MHPRTERKSKRMAIALLASLIAATPSWAAGDGRDTATALGSKASSAEPAEPIAAELAELRASVEEQAKRIAEHSKELESERAALNEELERIAALEAKLGVTPEVTGTPDALHVEPKSSAVGAVAGAEPAAQNSQRKPISIVTPEPPLSIRVGSAEFTPGGFFDLTGIFRSRDVGSGLGTNFTTIPYANALPLGQMSELRLSGQGSRLSLKVDARPTESTDVTGYVESDFNGFEPANSNISTKSDTFRLRLAFLQVRHGKWELVTGQTWSFLTPTREGLSPFPENIFSAFRLDTSYLAGLVYDRQPELRVVYHATDHWALGVALENPQQFAPSSVVFPTDGATNFFQQQFDNGSSSTSATSSAINPTVPNLHPDIEARTSFDWRISGGKLFHIDAGGVARSFKVYDNLVNPAATNTMTGGGVEFNTNFEVLRHFHLIENAFYGDGVGRYIGGLGPDVVVKPDGTLSAVHAGSAVGGFEWQATPKFLVDGYYSGAYFWRNFDMTTKALGTPCGPAGAEYCTGFGFVGSANTNNRDYQEGTIGFIPTIWSSPNYGKLQFISQFSYVVRNPWYVPAGQPKNAHIFIAYVNLRYIIP